MPPTPAAIGHRRRDVSAPDLARTTLSDQVVLHLARDIARGDLAPGDALPSEPHLAAAFNVSKPTIRESIRVLTGLGLVHAQQGKRTVVHAETAWNVLDPLVQEAFRLEGRGDALAVQLYEMRIILETSSAARAATRATPEQIEAMRSLADRLQAIAVEDHDRDGFLVVDRELHDVIAQASGNQVLRQVIRQVNGDLSTAWRSSSISEEELGLLADMHTAIIDAIAAGDAERARTAMDEHLQRAAAKTIEATK